MKGRYGSTLLILLAWVFIIFMLLIPMLSVVFQSLSLGWQFYVQSISTVYVMKSLGLTILVMVIAMLVSAIFGVAAAFAVSKFDFPGKTLIATLADIPFSVSPVIAGLAFLLTFGRLGWLGPYINQFNALTGLDIRIVFAIPGVILVTVFMTMPFVFREILPVLLNQGREEEEAAALMGASGWRIFKDITLPHIKWPLLYGIILCGARAMGEFGAVAAVSKARGSTFTLPLEIDSLYMSGTESAVVASFSVSSVLILLAFIMIALRTYAAHKASHR